MVSCDHNHFDSCRLTSTDSFRHSRSRRIDHSIQSDKHQTFFLISIKWPVYFLWFGATEFIWSFL